MCDGNVFTCRRQSHQYENAGRKFSYISFVAIAVFIVSFNHLFFYVCIFGLVRLSSTKTWEFFRERERKRNQTVDFFLLKMSKWSQSNESHHKTARSQKLIRKLEANVPIRSLSFHISFVSQLLPQIYRCLPIKSNPVFAEHFYILFVFSVIYVIYTIAW